MERRRRGPRSTFEGKALVGKHEGGKVMSFGEGCWGLYSNVVSLAKIVGDYTQRRTGAGGGRAFPLEFCVRQQYVSDRK